MAWNKWVTGVVTYLTSKGPPCRSRWWCIQVIWMRKWNQSPQKSQETWKPILTKITLHKSHGVFKIRCFSHFWNAPRFSRVIPSKPADFAPLPLVPLRRSHWRPASSMNGPCHLSSSCLCWCHKIPRRLVLGSGGFSLVEKNYRVGTYDRSKWSYNRKKIRYHWVSGVISHL